MKYQTNIESDMDDLLLNHQLEMFSIQQNEMIEVLIGAGCENVEEECHPFLWNKESKEVQQKLLPFLQQTVEAGLNETADHDYLFCNIGKDWIAANNRIFDCNSGQIMTVDQVING